MMSNLTLCLHTASTRVRHQTLVWCGSDTCVVSCAGPDLMQPEERDRSSLCLAELHCHLDGSLRASTFIELYNALVPSNSDSSMKFRGEEDVHGQLAFQPNWDLPRCLQSFATTLLVLQTPDNLERVSFEVCEDLHLLSNVTYAEIRYCPSLHRQNGMKDDDIVQAVYKGLTRAEEVYPDCQFRQIVTILRDLGPEEAMAMAQLACDHGRDKYIVGVDLAGNEYDHPPEEFVCAFDFVHNHESNLGITIHAGEGDSDAAEKNIWTAIDLLHASRIGHGVAARRSCELQKVLQSRDIPIEICITSNAHTGSIADLTSHPVKSFIEAGLQVIPCCDNSLLSQTTTRTEFDHLSLHYQIPQPKLNDVAKVAFNYGFLKKNK